VSCGAEFEKGSLRRRNGELRDGPVVGERAAAPVDDGEAEELVLPFICTVWRKWVSEQAVAKSMQSRIDMHDDA